MIDPNHNLVEVPIQQYQSRLNHRYQLAIPLYFKDGTGFYATQDQFQEFMNEAESPGRKLEFLTQEMFREANTIGSKASDVEISRHVVEIKGTLEKIRELVQNIE